MSHELNPTTDPNQPMVYQIRIKGHLGPQWTDWFGGLSITLEDDGDTLLTGAVVDQAALHGLLRKVRDLGMPLISAIRVKPGQANASDDKQYVERGERTMTTNGKTNTYRNTARIVGAMYLAGFVVGIGGIVLIQSILGAPDHLASLSASSMLLAIGAVLWLIAVVGDAAHGVLMFPVLKQHNERIAVGYLGFRIMDALFIAIMVLFILIQIPIGSEYLNAGASDASYLQALSTVFMQAQLDAYNIAMTTLGISGLILCYSFYKSKLVPRLLAVWGLVGYATILCGSVLEVLGFNLLSIHAIPGGLWEVFIGVWLIVKGFNSSAFVSEPAQAVMNESDKRSLSKA